MVTYGMLQAFLQGAFELIFPDNCLLCRQFLNSRHQRQLCPNCLGSLTLNPTPFSRQPALSTFAFDQAWSVCLYNETAQKLLHAFKYNSKTSLCKTFVPLMIDFIDRYRIPLDKFDLISPIPLHPVRLRERGYNQSSLLSLDLSRHYGISHSENLLIRQKNTTTQTELGAKQRWTNMEGAFKIKNSTDVKDKTIVLIDDLFTTGATLHSAAEALKTAGAARVGVLTLSATI
ncbi:MAG: ComF family protein [Candidatus Omnitrophica bacterium]|nr:ComF family protein [Candidatus Omnitrophota bacterium]